ncbi:hypothetical protein P6709_05850 [Jeotgalibacillus sp. ET6]|uniref:hypothetical protein n=1 Tax=Jeotgalibacillus sp. ET6 TaxID=3037260 RepID=UPI0024184394|nr:hypothetical protein [Jeotgalibacillus sp. ET6]MDG5471264.1 hypothetical protein [Jeotgalibacillus sp. ET6]
MDEAQWDIKEVKSLKRKQLIQYNIGMLLFIMLIALFAEHGYDTFIIGMLITVIWILGAINAYTLVTGKTIGTKSSKRVQEFDKNQLGEQRWKRNKMIETVIFSILGVGAAAGYILLIGFNPITLQFPSFYFPLFGSWVGYNAGEIARISKL